MARHDLVNGVTLWEEATAPGAVPRSARERSVQRVPVQRMTGIVAAELERHGSGPRDLKAAGA